MRSDQFFDQFIFLRRIISLQNDPDAPNDLRQKALRLAGRLIECDPDVRGGDMAPLFAAILSAAVMGEAPQAFHAVAFGLIVAGIFVSSRSQGPSARSK